MTIKVIIIDDSLLIRQLFPELLKDVSDIEVITTATDPFDAREKIKKYNPDVITLDIEMPKMDGITFLEKVMSLRPMPVLMVSSLTQKGADATIRALELGAVDYISKPTGKQDADNLSLLKNELIEKIRAAAKAHVKPLAKKASTTTQNRIIEIAPGTINKSKILAIGSSTGGVEALREVLSRFPANCPPTLIVQHMPEKFTASFAKRLDSLCEMNVHEATDGQKILPGNVYIAPGSKHLRIEKSSSGFVCSLNSGPNVSGHRPSVDVLFKSVAENIKENAVGAILTGMGRDGAEGMLAMKKAGSYNIGQDKATCVVYGMPKEAFELGAVDIQLPLVKVAEELLKKCLITR